MWYTSWSWNLDLTGIDLVLAAEQESFQAMSINEGSVLFLEIVLI